MARYDLAILFQTLTRSLLAFVGSGTHHLRAIYRKVKLEHPELCDDGFLCSNNCQSGYNSPEWQHTVRTVLNDLQRRGVVQHGPGRGYWTFR